MKKLLLFLLKLALTAVCLWWALNRVDWKDSILAHPGELEWSWLGWGLMLAGATVVLTAFRLWLLLWAQGIRITIWRATELTLIGNLFNLVGVGGIGGDTARIFLLIRDHPERKLAVTMTVMFDHLVGLVAMAMVFFLVTAGRFDALASKSVETDAMLRFAWLFFAGGLGMIFLMFLLAWPPVHDRIHARGREWKVAFLRQVPELYDLFRSKWPQVVGALAAAVVMLPVFYLSFWCAARAAGSDVAAGPVVIAMPVVDMFSALPLSVAGIGVREASLQVLMKDLTGMDAGMALAAGLIGFALSLVWALAGGLLLLRPADRVTVKGMKEATGGSDG